MYQYVINIKQNIFHCRHLLSTFYFRYWLNFQRKKYNLQRLSYFFSVQQKQNSNPNAIQDKRVSKKRKNYREIFSIRQYPAENFIKLYNFDSYIFALLFPEFLYDFNLHLFAPHAQAKPIATPKCRIIPDQPANQVNQNF